MTNNTRFSYIWFDQKLRDKMIDEKLRENSSFLVAWIGSIIATKKIKRADERYNKFIEFHKNNEMENVMDVIYDWIEETNSWSCFFDRVDFN